MELEREVQNAVTAIHQKNRIPGRPYASLYSFHYATSLAADQGISRNASLQHL
jgi:hypothetical protein